MDGPFFAMMQEKKSDFLERGDDMTKADSFVGFTDTGQPLVLADGCCEHFAPGKGRLLCGQSCWYCRYADFRKTVEATLIHSVCRCPGNQVCILKDHENEDLAENQGGYHHA